MNLVTYRNVKEHSVIREQPSAAVDDVIDALLRGFSYQSTMLSLHLGRDPEGVAVLIRKKHFTAASVDAWAMGKSAHQ